MKNYLDIIEKMNEDNLPYLHEVVMAALELFSKNKIGDVKFREFKKPLVVGSGNAIATAKILFDSKDAVYADETNFREKLNVSGIDGVIVFSASGGKHAPIIAKHVIDEGFECQLVTCTKNSQGESVVGSKNTIVTLKNREPYTYNTSTYLGWILAKTREDPNKIMNFILEEIEPMIPKFFDKYYGFLLVTPDQFSSANHLFEVKFIELFGRRVARDVKTYEEMRHAITVVPSDRELAIQFGEGSFDFQGQVFSIPLPENCDIGTFVAIGYYVIGRIQEQFPQFFKENIKNYIARNSKGEFGKAMKVIVE